MRLKRTLSLLLGIAMMGLISAAESPFSEVGGQLTERIFNSVIWIGLGFILVATIGGTMWYFLIYKRKFDIFVKIHSERASDRYNMVFDKAAILTDRKTKTKYFKLWNARVELPVPPFNILQNTNKGDFLELRRSGEDNWSYMEPSKIDKVTIIKSDGKIYPVTQQKTTSINPDMGYWSARRNEQNKGMFDPEKIWMKILPYIPHIVGGFIMIFMLYILMSHLPEILSQLRDLTAELNRRSSADVTTGLLLLTGGLRKNG